MYTNIRQQVTLPGSPHQVYEALMDPERHAAFTGAPCEVDRAEGGAVSCHGGWVIGRNVELIEDQRIVQAWRGKDWGEGEFSMVRYELEAADDGRTRLTLTHTGVPEEHHDKVDQGWHEAYWEPLKKYLAS